jgi:diguanylate cyclase (GGDEF)-like protein
MLNASRNLVETIAFWGQSPPSKLIFAPNECLALRRGRIHLADGFHSRLFCQHINHSPSAAYMCVPMMAQSEALGVLYLQSESKELSQPEEMQERLPESKRRLAINVAELMGLALGNLKLRETLRAQSIRDPLTNLFNRRYMEETLEREIHRASRSKYQLGIIMLDLDHFKLFNDTFGHDAGDTLLRALGKFLQIHIRGGDIACRYGGEEFVLIMPEASLDVTQRRAEQLREGVKHLNVQHHGQSLGIVTLSLGVATFPEHGSNAEATLKAADSALYRAKQEGRDRVAVG